MISTQAIAYEIQRQQHQVQFYEELLGESATLKMMVIPGGVFLMGSDEDASEMPKHEVTIPAFSFGKYPVTQEQWREVAALPQINRKLDPAPSGFKGDNLPVESITWYDAVEFCERLSAHTTRRYRLPTEAEWEYACRAGTTTPYHFGETIAVELANFRQSEDRPKVESKNLSETEESRESTTPIGFFEGTNAFGLSDMHGNVWEWCQDHWHDNYKGAPIDGSAWITKDEEASRSLRGGSWDDIPYDCRSACRYGYGPGDANDYFLGFRVACSAPRTL